MSRSPSSPRRSPRPSTRPSTPSRTPSARSAERWTRFSSPSRSALAAALGALLALALVPAAASAAFTLFQTPSGNTGCAITGKSVRCDLLRNDAAKPPRPASCEFEWGNSFGLDRTGRAKRLCNSDTVFDPDARVLAYGSSISRKGIKCTSRSSGLRCKNRSGHGFKLSREAQKLF